MKISVALCTYNGAKYILPQLESIARQTIIPNEVIVCDDGSTDETINVIELFKLSTPLSIKLYRNEQNLGSTKNFEKAISLCRGDIIFLSDQDDVWLPEKIQKINALFETNLNVEVVFTDGYIVNNNLEVIDTLWNKIQFTPRQQELWKNGRAFEQLMRYGSRATGATMAIKKRFLSRLLPFEIMNFWIHDGIISLKAALNKKILCLDEKLILYRHHVDQQLGLKLPEERPFQSLKNKITNLMWINKDPFPVQNYQDLQIMSQWLNDSSAPEVKRAINQKMKHLQIRMSLTNKNFFGKAPVVVYEWLTGNYKKYSCGTNISPWILVVKDLLGK